MDTSLLYGLFLFSFVASITPGPNNLMLLASGANFGVKRTIPHILGVNLGFTLMCLIVGLGLMKIFDIFPLLKYIMMCLSAIYLLWLAWKIAHAGAPENSHQHGKPFTFLQAAAFQWVNPKAWIMAMTAHVSYPQGDGWTSALFVSLVFFLVNAPCIMTWAWAGQHIQRFLTTPLRLKVFNWSMAILLILSLGLALFHEAKAD